jgi:UPF0716 protein FxsA
MLETRSLIRFLDPGYLLKWFLLILLFSLLPLGDMYLLTVISGTIPRFLLFAGVTATGLLGLVLCFFSATRLLKAMKRRIRDGYYHPADYFQLIGILLAAVLLLTPGLIGDVLGLLFLLPAFRRIVGRLAAGNMHERFKELYEYLKLYEL